MNILTVTEKEVEEVCRLAHEIWPIHYTPIIGDAQVRFMLENRYSKQEITNQIVTRQADYYLIQSEDENIGYAAISKKNEGSYFLDKLYILQHKQHKGVGYFSLIEILTRYPDLLWLRLQVNRLNFKAINFYFKFGFTIENTEDFDIGSGYFMNDFIMVYHTRK